MEGWCLSSCQDKLSQQGGEQLVCRTKGHARVIRKDAQLPFGVTFCLLGGMQGINCLGSGQLANTQETTVRVRIYGSP